MQIVIFKMQENWKGCGNLVTKTEQTGKANMRPLNRIQCY